MTISTKQRRPDISRTVKKGDAAIVLFLKELMQRRKRLPSQLAADLGISHPTVARWLARKDTPSTASCRKLAEYSGVPVEKVLSMAGHLPDAAQTVPAGWPEFREYARRKYPAELDEDIITVIEDLIEHRRAKKYGRHKS
jgi:transcriptional regulator with XRE-family HTH domain